jgi:hypothetical protein
MKQLWKCTPRQIRGLWPQRGRANRMTVTCRLYTNPKVTLAILLWIHRKFGFNCLLTTCCSGFFDSHLSTSRRQHAQNMTTTYKILWRACNLTSFSPCLTGPVDYPFASRHREPRIKSPGGTYVKPGFSC